VSPKDFIQRAQKRQNRTGLVEAIDTFGIEEAAPKYRRTRWGWSLSELEGRCFSYAPWGGGWPLTMGFRKHLYTEKGVCRRCGCRRPTRVEWNPARQGFIVGGANAK
jgi:hypothetical protein